MSGAKPNHDSFLAGFKSLKPDNRAAFPAWIQSVKNDARDRFADLGFPTTRLEQWKYTNVAPIARIPFQPAHNGSNGSVANISAVEAIPLSSTRLVFINGHYSERLSNPAMPSDRGSAGSLSSFLQAGHEELAAHLTRYADYREHAFVALNTALLEDGAVIQIPDRAVLEQPIYIVFYSEPGEAEVLSSPRLLILAGESSQASIVEIYAGGDNAYLTNAVTEVVLGENAVIDHYKLQRESDSAFHISTIQAHLARSASFHSHSVSLGGLLVRNDINVVLDGEGCECSLDGLYIQTGRQHVDNHTLIDHAKANGSSRELYKGILDDKSTGVFNGSVIVRKDAQKTDALQTNKNLLLSEGAEINTKPQLEIFADDVKCSHGATVGQIDQEALFYMRSRGLDYHAARGLLLCAFSNEILNRIKSRPVRSLVAEALFKKVALGPDFPISSFSEEL